MFSRHYFGRSYFGASYFGKGASAPAEFIFDVDHGAFAMTGQAIDLRVTRLMVANHGSFALSGQDVEISVDEGQVPLSGTGGPYLKGDLVRIAGTFTDVDDIATDPDTVTFRVRKPDGAIEEFVYGDDVEVTRASAGVYYIDWDCVMAGRHLYGIMSTGAVQAVTESEFYVTESGFN